MDFEDIGSKLANLSMYDVKQLYTQAKNYALNVSEIEAKVNEATSNDAWGASSTLMQEIANATHNFQDFNEIMPTIYRKFMEKEARDWRQIYKALQLLEYLVKHGSERVVDDARSHVSTIKILRNFHYIDEAAKDQGINVRNRAKEIAELLSDVDRIRQERRRARANKNKYQGTSNSDFVPGSGGGRYGGFGSDSYNPGMASGSGGGGDSYGGGGRDRQESFDEYDAGDFEEGGGRTSTSGSANRATGTSGARRGNGSSATPPDAPKKEEKVVDLFSFDDDEPSSAPVNNSSSSVPKDDFGDDFDDFQGATPIPTASISTPTAISPTTSNSNRSKSNSDVFDFLGETSTPNQPNRQTSISSTTSSLQPTRPSVSNSRNNSTTSTNLSTTNKSNASSGGLGGFDDLWSASSGNASSTTSAPKGKLTMAQMAKDKSQSSVWGSGTGGNSNQAQNQGGKKDLFDLL